MKQAATRYRKAFGGPFPFSEYLREHLPLAEGCKQLACAMLRLAINDKAWIFLYSRYGEGWIDAVDLDPAAFREGVRTQKQQINLG